MSYIATYSGADLNISSESERPISLLDDQILHLLASVLAAPFKVSTLQYTSISNAHFRMTVETVDNRKWKQDFFFINATDPDPSSSILGGDKFKLSEAKYLVGLCSTLLSLHRAYSITSLSVAIP